MKFNSLLLLTACVALLASCSGEKKASGPFSPGDYTLTVTNIEAEGLDYAYLYDYDELAGRNEPNEAALVDSARIVDGQASFKVKNGPAMLMLTTDNNYLILPDAGENTYDIATLKGSGVMAQKLTAYRDTITAVYMSATENMPGRDTPEYQAFADSVDALIMEIEHNTLSENINNALGLYMVTSYSDLKASQLDSLINLSPALADSKRVQALKTELDKAEETSAGHPYKDFEIEYNGNTYKLSDYVKPGEYTLVDFWASWCGPCKRAIAGLKENYEELHAKGLNVVGVGVWEDPEKTKVWLADNPLPWDLILNAQNIPTDLYGIKGIPTMILVGPDGTILCRSYSDEEVLEAFNKAIAE